MDGRKEGGRFRQDGSAQSVVASENPKDDTDPAEERRTWIVYGQKPLCFS